MPAFVDLPKELLLDIFSHLDSETVLHSLSLVCKRISSISRDNILWQKFCRDLHYDQIEFPERNLQLSTNYWEEFRYQKYVDQTTAKYLQDIVNDPSKREVGIAAIPRIGLRARLHLVQVFDSESTTIQEKYYARELIYAINQRHSVIEILSMFYFPTTFDPFTFLLAFDSFYLDRSNTAGPASEQSYSVYITYIKSLLLPLKSYLAQLNETKDSLPASKVYSEYLFIVQNFGFILYQAELLNDISVRDINPGNVSGLFLYGVFHNQRPSISLVSAILYHYFATWIGLPASIVVLDFDAYIRIENPTYTHPPSQLQPQQQQQQQSRPHSRSNNQTSLGNNINGAHNIENNNNNNNDDDFTKSECFFVDVNRAGKIRDVEEMNGIIRLGRGRHTSLKPSSSKDIVDVFMRHFTDGYSLHQDSSRTSAVMFLGVMIFSFISIFAEKNRKNVPLMAQRETNNSRNITKALEPIDLVNLPSLSDLTRSGRNARGLGANGMEYKNNNDYNYGYDHTNIYGNNNNNNNDDDNDNDDNDDDDGYYRRNGFSSDSEEKLTQLYTMATSSLTYQIPCDFNLVYDFLFKLAPRGISMTDKKNTVSKLCSQLNLESSFTEQDFDMRKRFRVRPRYHIGQVHHVEPTGIYGVIVGWYYVSQVAGRSIRFTPNSSRRSSNSSNSSNVNDVNNNTGSPRRSNNGSAASSSNSSNGTSRSNNDSNSTLRSSSCDSNYDIESPSTLVQYIILLDSSRVFKLLESSLNIVQYSLPALLDASPTFFGIEVGRFFRFYDESQRAFVPVAELLSQFQEDEKYFSKILQTSQQSRNNNNNNNNNTNNETLEIELDSGSDSELDLDIQHHQSHPKNRTCSVTTNSSYNGRSQLFQ